MDIPEKISLVRSSHSNKAIACSAENRFTAILEQEVGIPLNFMFRISDSDLKQCRRSLSIKSRFGKTKKLNEEEFESHLTLICGYCLQYIPDLHELHMRRNAAVDIINDLIQRMDTSYVKTEHAVHLVWSIMSCVHHFQLRFKSGTNTLITWARKKKAKACLDLFNNLIHALPKSMCRIILNSLLIFYQEGRLWEVEFQLGEMIIHVLYMFTDVEEAIDDILVSAEYASLQSETEARMLIKLLYELLENLKWVHISEKIMNRLLEMLKMSYVPPIFAQNFEFHYAEMKLGLTICLRNIIKNLGNEDLMTFIVMITKAILFDVVNPYTTLEFGSIGEYAALHFSTEKYTSSLHPPILKAIHLMMASEDPNIHLIGYRIAMNLLDRQNNRLEFENPRLFFRGVRYKIKLRRYSASDYRFYKQYRLKCYNAVMAGVPHHVHRKINMENIYTFLAICCVEVPCAYVAATVASYAMAFQEYVLVTNPSNIQACHHVHAIAMSLMTLVCYVHQAEVLYDYVGLIMERRSELAPHLNPPLKTAYDYAERYIIWNKPDLFFEDWEVRYGLFKCFKSTNSKKKNKKV